MNKEPLNILYLKAWGKVTQQRIDNPEVLLHTQKSVFHGVKFITTTPEGDYTTREQAVRNFQFISLIKDLVSLLTPEQFIEIFPIEKVFDGEKYQTKDYYYTRSYIDSMDPLEPIGGEALKFLWDYANPDIRIFNLKSMSAMSDLRELDGYPSMGEEWADMNGVPTHNIHQDAKGNKIIIVDGKPMKLNRPKQLPSYLKLVK